MTGNDVFLLVVRWVHITASVVWLGGSIFYLLVLRPAVRRSGEGGRGINQMAAAEFRFLVDVSFFLILVTGISLTFDRLSQGVVGTPYVVVLGIKILLSVWMFLQARSRRRRTALLEAHRERPSPPSGLIGKSVAAVSGYNTIVVLGVIIFLLADILRMLYEIAIR